jgi:hypothetical protein
MDFQAYNKILISDDNLTNVVAGNATIGYEFKIKYPSYRGVFLSCIEQLEFFVDDRPIDKNDIFFYLNGKQFLIDELPELFKEYWYISNKATIRVLDTRGIAAGSHKIRVFMKHRVPYTGYFGEYLVLDSDVTKMLTAARV